MSGRGINLVFPGKMRESATIIGMTADPLWLQRPCTHLISAINKHYVAALVTEKRNPRGRRVECRPSSALTRRARSYGTEAALLISSLSLSPVIYHYRTRDSIRLESREPKTARKNSD
jgi:hypothetical protein